MPTSHLWLRVLLTCGSASGYFSPVAPGASHLWLRVPPWDVQQPPGLRDPLAPPDQHHLPVAGAQDPAHPQGLGQQAARIIQLRLSSPPQSPGSLGPVGAQEVLVGRQAQPQGQARTGLCSCRAPDPGATAWVYTGQTAEGWMVTVSISLLRATAVSTLRRGIKGTFPFGTSALFFTPVTPIGRWLALLWRRAWEMFGKLTTGLGGWKLGGVEGK